MKKNLLMPQKKNQILHMELLKKFHITPMYAREIKILTFFFLQTIRNLKNIPYSTFSTDIGEMKMHCLTRGDSSLKLRQIIGNAIAQGDAEEMIVVFPDIYASDT